MTELQPIIDGVKLVPYSALEKDEKYVSFLIPYVIRNKEWHVLFIPYSLFVFKFVVCRFSECWITQCQFAECLSAKCRFTECGFSECRFAEYRIAEC